jgi:toxin ParE1/3/4
MKVHFSRRSLAQLAEIVAGLESDNPPVARSFVRRLETLASLLSRHPQIRRSTNLAGVRVMPLRPYPYLLFYQAAGPARITVLRIRHMARNMDWRQGR